MKTSNYLGPIMGAYMCVPVSNIRSYILSLSPLCTYITALLVFKSRFSRKKYVNFIF